MMTISVQSSITSVKAAELPETETVTLDIETKDRETLYFFFDSIEELQSFATEIHLSVQDLADQIRGGKEDA